MSVHTVTKASVEQDFRNELAALLAKWKAEIEVDREGVTTVYIAAIYTANNDCERPFTHFELGGAINPETVRAR